MKIKNLHNWNLSYAQARGIQTALAERLRFSPLKQPPRTVAGLDCAFSKDKKHIFAVVVVLNFDDFEIIEQTSARMKVTFPYIPGLLSFREAPACLAATEKLKTTPDIFLVDGQGIAHRRRLGLAAHLGLFLDRPTIGCAKSRLIGSFDEVDPEKGSYSWLKDGSDTIGAVLRTRTNVKPLFVSVGNRCLLADAIKITLHCATKYRLPEPTRIAHQMVSKLKLKG